MFNLTKISWNIFAQKFSYDNWSNGAIRLNYMPLYGHTFHWHSTKDMFGHLNVESSYLCLLISLPSHIYNTTVPSCIYTLCVPICSYVPPLFAFMFV